jgi:hypothetical protein
MYYLQAGTVSRIVFLPGYTYIESSEYHTGYIESSGVQRND